jgi:hypothetical protein
VIFFNFALPRSSEENKFTFPGCQLSLAWQSKKNHAVNFPIIELLHSMIKISAFAGMTSLFVVPAGTDLLKAAG